MTGTRAGGDTLTLRVAAREAVAERIVALELEPDAGIDLPAWAAGSHVDLHLGEGLTRQYSLSRAPGTGRWRLGVLQESDSRGGSSFVHDRLRVGSTLEVSLPRNTFPFEIGSRPLVFVAGGIGITPILSMVSEATARDHEWSLLYLTREPAATAFGDELTAYGDRVRLHHDSVDGTLDLAATLDALGASDADVYACGPAGLLDALEAYAGARPGARLVVERFSGTEGSATREGDHAFTVVLTDGTEIDVPVGTTVLEALARAGVPLVSSCQEGVCGTCETAVLEGTPDHRDHVLSDEERASGEMMMPCVSRCLGKRLLLDL